MGRDLKGWKGALAAAGVAGACAACATLCMPDRFRARARILPDLGSVAPAARSGVWAPTAPPGGQGSREDGPTVIFAEILRSRRVADQVLGATYDYGVRAWPLGTELRRRGTLAEHLGAAGDAAHGAFQRILGVDRKPRSGLLTVTAETVSPELSLQVVRGAVEALRGTLADFARAEARSRAEALEPRLAEARAAHAEASGRFRDFLASNRNWAAGASPQVHFQGSQLKERVDLWARVLANLTLNREQALLEAGNQAPALLVLDGGSLPLRKCGPPRALLVLGAMAAAGGGVLAATHRHRIRGLFVSMEQT